MTAETRKELETLFKPQIEFINGLSKTILPAINFYSSLPNLENAIGISQIANSIVMPTIPLIQQVSSIAPMISNLGQNVIELGSLFQKISASTQLISSLANNLGSVFNQASKLSDYFKPAQFYATLPNLTEINQIWVEIKEGGEAFKQAGFGFIAGEYVSVKTVLRFASVNPRIRSALITNQMAAEARSQEFEQELKKIFLQSSVLRRRWHIVEQVIRAHRRREYNIAVPAVLAQVEGIIGDALILNGLVISQAHKLYKKDHNGKLILSKNGDPVEIRGVGTLIQHSKWQTHPALQGVAELIANQLAGERNPILHGRRTNYGVARLSAQGLLLLFVLAAQITEFEEGKIS